MLRNMLVEATRFHKDIDDKGYRLEARDVYAHLRMSWERGVEKLLFNGAVLRFRKGIETNRLGKVTIEPRTWKPSSPTWASAPTTPATMARWTPNSRCRCRKKWLQTSRLWMLGEKRWWLGWRARKIRRQSRYPACKKRSRPAPLCCRLQLAYACAMEGEPTSSIASLFAPWLR